MQTPKTVYIIFAHGISLTPFYQSGPDGDWVEYLLKKGLEERGYTVKFTHDAAHLTDVAALISWEVDQKILSNVSKLPKDRTMLIAFEPPHVRADYYDARTREAFGKTLVFFDDIVDNKKYFRFYFPVHEGRCLRKPTSVPSFDQKRLCAATHSNVTFTYYHPDELYTVRKKAFEFFGKTGDFDMYGRGWEELPCWKGFAENQVETLKNYKFYLIFENWQNRKGYITERIFSGLTSGSIPVYLGASDIDQYVPKDCFIDYRNFSSHQDLYNFMKSMDRETYEKHIQAIDQFYKTTDVIKLFSKENWVHTVISNLPL